MSQTPCVARSSPDSINYTPVSAVTAGDIVVLGTNLVLVALANIAAAAQGALATRGKFNGPKDSSNVTAGIPMYWDADGSPVGGTALSGALTTNSALGPFAGFACEDAGTGVGDVDFILRSVDSSTLGNFTAMPTATVAAAGSSQTDAASITTGFTLVTAADDTKGVKLPAAVAGSVAVVKSSVSNKILKVYPATGDAINALSANAAISLASGPTIAMFIAYDATTWYTLPLLPS